MVSLKWLENYLTNCIQNIEMNKDNTTSFLRVKWNCVPDSSTLQPLLFLIYLNDLSNISSILDPFSFVGDTNLVFLHKEIKVVLKTVNNWLQRVNECSISNKLTLNTQKTFHSLFPKKTASLYYCPANIYLFKVNNRSSGKSCELCSKLIIKIPEQRQWRRSSVFIVNFEPISHLFLVFLL